MPPTPQAMQAGYHALWSRAAINPARKAEATAVARRILARRADYAVIETATGVPLAMIAAIHNRESSLRFDRHLHCGDPLTARTVHVPRGRPATGEPPFTFAQSAIDALTMPPHGLDKVKLWSVERILYETEKYNGWGYLGKSNSPYLWAGTGEYVGGKFVADHVYDANAVDRQLGCVAVMKALAELDPAIARSLNVHEGALPRDVVEAATRPARNARNGGVVIAATGAAGEAGRKAAQKGADASATTAPVPAAHPKDHAVLPGVAFGLLVIGIAVVLAAFVVERRRLTRLRQKWPGA